MSDLIDREKAIEQMSLYGSVWMDYTDDMTKEQVAEKALRASKQVLIEAVKQLPSAQPETIYCKDCKHWIPYDWMFSEVWQSKNIADYPEDDIGCDCSEMAMKANDFCSRAERREDE